MRATTHLLSQRLTDVADVHLRDVIAGAASLRRLSPNFAKILLENSENILVELAAPDAQHSLARALAAGMATYMTREHQFVQLASNDRMALENRYSSLVEGLAPALTSGDPEAKLAQELKHHHNWLQAWITNLLEDAGALNAARAGLNIVCAEYSPQGQLRILGLAGIELLDPILDIGCGETGPLVRYLRSAGHDVIGVDQDAREDLGLQRGSWFDLPVRRSSWGTIIAHQSFSLHFLHAHMASGERSAVFAQTFMAILATLKPGGRFAYAPGVPFFERHLDRERFAVVTRAISLPVTAMPPALAVALDHQPLGATIVTRLK